MHSVGLLGASGRMGQIVSKLIQEEYKGKLDLLSLVSEDDEIELLLEENVVIDFSGPAALESFIDHAMKNNKFPALASGTTGLTDVQLKKLAGYAKKAPVIYSSNFSTGVYALRKIVRQASELMTKLGYSPVLLDTHHKHKVDAPSGTALSLQEDIRPNDPRSVQTQCFRSGEVIGEHEVTFHGQADKVSIGHVARDRSIFARGAIDAANWAASQSKPGMYSMDDYVGSL